MSLSFCVQKVESTGVSFSYNGFNEFRHRIARSIGLKDVDPSMSDTDMYMTGRYKEIESSHPMYPLIDHDDNEGDLGPDDCGMVGSYLQVLIEEWEKELADSFDNGLDHAIKQGKKLAEVMLECHENGNTLLFL